MNLNFHACVQTFHGLLLDGTNGPRANGMQIGIDSVRKMTSCGVIPVALIKTSGHSKLPRAHWYIFAFRMELFVLRKLDILFHTKGSCAALLIWPWTFVSLPFSYFFFFEKGTILIHMKRWTSYYPNIFKNISHLNLTPLYNGSIWPM